MRILFTFAGGSGHFEPLIPIARAAQAAGHTVACAGQPAMLAAIEAAGFAAFASGGATVSDAPERLPLLRLDMQREERAVRDGYAGRIAGQRAANILALCAEWQPDMIVRDEMDFGSAVAAERLRLPHAAVLVIAAGSLVRPDIVAAPLNHLRAEHDLPHDAELAMLSRYLVISPFPASYRDPAFPLPATAHSIRPHLPSPTPSADTPAWAARLGSRPAVYFTLGTVFNIESGDLFARVLAGLRELPIDVVATVGREIDPAEFGPQPANIQIERFIPQALVLPRCAAVVSHGGSGSVIGALAHGLPSVLIPMGADQPLNAVRCVELGVAQALDAVDATPESIRDAVATVLAGPSYRQAAARLRAEIASLPGPQHAVALIERLAAERRPILSAEGSQ